MSGSKAASPGKNCPIYRPLFLLKGRGKVTGYPFDDFHKFLWRNQGPGPEYLLRLRRANQPGPFLATSGIIRQQPSQIANAQMYRIQWTADSIPHLHTGVLWPLEMCDPNRD